MSLPHGSKLTRPIHSQPQSPITIAGRCFPCVTKKQCSNILGVYDSFAAMVRAQGVEDADSAKLQEAFFTAVHDGEEGAAQALAHALNSGEACKWVYVCVSIQARCRQSVSQQLTAHRFQNTDEEEEGSEEEVVAPPPKRKSKKATAAAAKPKKDTKKKAAAAKPKAEAKPKPKAKPKAPRLSHGEWESAVLRALAAAAAEGVEAAVVHDAVAADVGAAAYKKGQVGGVRFVLVSFRDVTSRLVDRLSSYQNIPHDTAKQVTGALGRLETQGLVQQATPAEAAAAEEAEPEEGGAKKRKRKRKALPLWSLTEAGRARADGESEEDEAEAEAEEQEAVVAAVLKPEAKAKARKPAKAKAAAKKKTKAVASSSKGKKKAKAVKAEAAEEEMEEDGDDESEAAAAKSKPQPKPKKKTRADAVVDPARLQCAMSQRFFCLAGAIDVGDATHAHPSGVFEVLSAKSQSVYKVG